MLTAILIIISIITIPIISTTSCIIYCPVGVGRECTSKYHKTVAKFLVDFGID